MAEKVMAYCIKCQKKTEMKDPKIESLPNKRNAWVGKCSICGTKQVRLVSKEEAENAKK